MSRRNEEIYLPTNKSTRNSIIGTIDTAFFYYRSNIRTLLHITLAFVFLFCIPTYTTIHYNIFSSPSPVIPLSVQYITGDIHFSESRLTSAIVAQLLLFDGAIPWTIATAVFSAALRPQDQITPNKYWIGLQVLVLALLGAILPATFHAVGLGVLGDLLRWPFLFAPCVLVLEQTSVWGALRRSAQMVWRNPSRSFGMFALTLMIIRLIWAGSLITMFLVLQIAPGDQETELLGTWLPPTILLLEAICYPAAHLSIALCYTDLRDHT